MAKKKPPYRKLKKEHNYNYKIADKFTAETGDSMFNQEEGHWGSRIPYGKYEGRILKTEDHPTFHKTIEGEKNAGMKFFKKFGNLYSFPEDPGLLYRSYKPQMMYGGNTQLGILGPSPGLQMDMGFQTPPSSYFPSTGFVPMDSKSNQYRGSIKKLAAGGPTGPGGPGDPIDIDKMIAETEDPGLKKFLTENKDNLKTMGDLLKLMKSNTQIAKKYKDLNLVTNKRELTREDYKRYKRATDPMLSFESEEDRNYPEDDFWGMSENDPFKKSVLDAFANTPLLDKVMVGDVDYTKLPKDVVGVSRGVVMRNAPYDATFRSPPKAPVLEKAQALGLTVPEAPEIDANKFKIYKEQEERPPSVFPQRTTAIYDDKKVIKAFEGRKTRREMRKLHGNPGNPQYSFGGDIKGWASGESNGGNSMGVLSMGAGLVGGMINQGDNPTGLGAFASGGLKGAAAGAQFGPWGAAIGGVIGGVGSLIGFKKEQKAEEERKRAELEAKQTGLRQARYSSNSGALGTFPTEGVEGAQNYYAALGGQVGPQYEAEGEEVIQHGLDPQVFGDGMLNPLAGDMSQIEGPTHGNGGVDMSSQSNDFIFSNRLKSSDNLLGDLHSITGKKFTKGTYADLAGKIGKLKGKYEEKMESFDPVAVSTGELMLERLEEALELVKFEQEYRKQQKNVT